jgi:hypothetical protein
LGDESVNNPNHNLHAVHHVVYNGPSNGQVPTQAQLDEWILTYGLVNNVYRPFSESEALSVFEKRECTFLLETAGMTILWKECTCTGGNCTTSVELGLSQLDAALTGN